MRAGMHQSTVLEYQPPPAKTRPRLAWPARLGVASTVLGMLGVLAGVVRTRSALDVFDPTFHWNYPPPVWVDRAYVASMIAAVAVSLLLVCAGILTLVRPSTVFRVHGIYAICKLPVVIAAALFHSMQMWPHPDVSRGEHVAEFIFECLFFGAYALFVLFNLRTKSAKMASATEIAR